MTTALRRFYGSCNNAGMSPVTLCRRCRAWRVGSSQSCRRFSRPTTVQDELAAAFAAITRTERRAAVRYAVRAEAAHGAATEDALLAALRAACWFERNASIYKGNVGIRC
jgi:hypothetical protein